MPSGVAASRLGGFRSRKFVGCPAQVIPYPLTHQTLRPVPASNTQTPACVKRRIRFTLPHRSRSANRYTIKDLRVRRKVNTMDSRAMWMRMKAHRWAYTLSILATLTVGILIGTLISSEVKGKEGQKGDATPLSLPAVQPTNNPLSQAFAQIAKQLEPSVVNINT